jgi:drug/metabolite transporter (DMT)-like permease
MFLLCSRVVHCLPKGIARMQPSPKYVYGVVLVTAAAVFWSTAGVFMRLLPLDVWTILAWRSLFAALSLALVVAVQSRGQLVRAVRDLGWPGLAVIPVAATSMAAYVVALSLTTVANVMVIYATVPFAAAAIAWFLNGERVTMRFVVASALAVLGIAIMAGSAAGLQDLLGAAIALLMTLAFAVQLVMARRYQKLDMSIINAFGAAACGLACLPLMTGPMPDFEQMAILALFGCTTTALAYALFMIGGRYVPSGEAGLISMIDVVLAPFWVWLLFSEDPGAAALAGGGLVIGAVVFYLLGSLRKLSA